MRYSALFIGIALRNLSREKSYALINIVGLALAIACGIILFAYIESELTYDQHNVNHERIFRINFSRTTGGSTTNYALAPNVLSPLFKRDYPDMIDYVRMTGPKGQIFKSGDIERDWDDILSADVNFFDMFDHEVIYGDLSTALNEPTAIAISESFARFHFGERNPIGETLQSDPFDHQVTAVFADIPENSHQQYSAVISNARTKMLGYGSDDQNPDPGRLFSWGLYTYFMTKGGFTERDLQLALDKFYENHAAEYGKQSEMSAQYFTLPLKNVHYSSGWMFEQPTGNIFYVYTLIAIALFVVLIACINYTNLATARATRRAREVGMRKILGASRRQLMLQFLGESAVYAVVALMVAAVLVYMANAYTPLNTLLGKTELLNIADDPELLLYIAFGTVLVAILAGAYPAFYLSSIAPLFRHGTIRGGKKTGFWLRQSLVFIQFLVSVGVLSATMIMELQMNYVANKPLGYDKDNKLHITIRGVNTLEKIPVIKNELLQHGSIHGFAQTGFSPDKEVLNNSIEMENNAGQMEVSRFSIIYISEEYIDVIGMEIVAGRDFSKRLITDVGLSVLVNEAMVKDRGWENPLGKRIQEDFARVIGVVKDFHFASLHEPVMPLIMVPFWETDYSDVPPLQHNLISRSFVADIAPDNVPQTINYIESVINKFSTKHPFEYRFYDDLLNEIYADENNLITLTTLLAGICIFIAMIGMYGLAAFNTEQRTKEIGIRKVLGATTSQIITLLSKGMLVLVILASLLGSIASYFAVEDWLLSFAYRTEIALWIFLLASAVVALITFSTIALQTFFTARANPVEALRYE